MYDVAIVGAGVSRQCHRKRIIQSTRQTSCVIERDEDVCDGTSKANSAIVHAGFDASPGFLKGKAQCPRQRDDGCRCPRTWTFPFKRNGSLVVCTKDQDCSAS